MPQPEPIAACVNDAAGGNRRKLSRNEVNQVVARILVAAARYDHYKARQAEWTDYKSRRTRLGDICSSAKQLEGWLTNLDVMTRDDLAIRLGPGRIEATVAHLEVLQSEVEELARHLQVRGRPKDLAMERWVGEMADIFKGAFGTRPNVWGRRNPGPFCRLLDASRPDSSPVHGGLALSQIRRVLDERFDG